MQYEKFNDVMEKKLEEILRNIDMQKKIFIWGYGEGGEIIYNLLRQKGIMQVEVNHTIPLANIYTTEI